MENLLEFQRNIKLSCSSNEFRNNTYHYNITVQFIGETTSKYTIEKTKKQIQRFHQSIAKFIFQLDPPFDKKYINKEDSSQTTAMINVYLSHVQERIDCLTSRHFINFFQFDKNLPNSNILVKQYVEELSDVNISLKDEEIVDMQWQPQQKILFVVSQNKKKTKIQNLLKLFISNDTGINGSLQIIKFSEQKGQWVKISSQLIEAEVHLCYIKPLSLTWSHKNSTLVVSSTIGIYVYMIGLNSQDIKINLIDFVEIPGISSVASDPQIASIYVLSNGINYEGKSKLIAYSIKKQSSIQIPIKLYNSTSMTFQKSHRRLYISDDQGIKIFKVENDTQKVIFQNFKKIHFLKHDSSFDQLVLSSEQKPQYLFGYNKNGFITVFELKPPEKQFLMNVLTNIECPAKWTSIERIWSKKLFCVNFQTHLVFISMKNQPMWVKQNGISSAKIKKIIFDQQNQRLMYCDNNKLKICQIFF